METHGIPNDIWSSLEPLLILILVPFLNSIALPSLRRIGITLRPTTRIAWGFIIMALAMAYAAIIQSLIYHSPPCYQHPLRCQGGKVPNRVHVALQVPAYTLVAVSEILTASSGMEYAFTQAPQSMRSIVMASFLITLAGGAFLGIAITLLTADPKLTWMYSCLSGMCFVLGGVFQFTFRNSDGGAASKS